MNPYIQGISSQNPLLPFMTILRNLFHYSRSSLYRDLIGYIHFLLLKTTTPSHHHHFIETRRKTDAAATRSIATSVCFFEACCRTVGASIIHRTDFKVLVVRPSVMISELAITVQKPLGSLSILTVYVRRKTV